MIFWAEVARGLGCHAYRVGGMADHAHLALTLPIRIGFSTCELTDLNRRTLKALRSKPTIFHVSLTCWWGTTEQEDLDYHNMVAALEIGGSKNEVFGVSAKENASISVRVRREPG